MIRKKKYINIPWLAYYVKLSYWAIKNLPFGKDLPDMENTAVSD